MKQDLRCFYGLTLTTLTSGVGFFDVDHRRIWVVTPIRGRSVDVFVRTGQSSTRGEETLVNGQVVASESDLTSAGKT